MAEDEAAALQLDNCPMRMVALPGGKALILALAGGGLLQIRVEPGEGSSPPTLTPLTGAPGVMCRVSVTSFEYRAEAQTSGHPNT